MMKKEALVAKLHKPIRKNFLRRRVIQKGLNDTWQIDLVEMIPYSRENKGYKYILTIIDIFSKYAYGRALKKKDSLSVVQAMIDVLENSRLGPPKNIHSDQGKEFFNKNFESLMKKHGINHFHTFSKMKASIIERWNRTFKNKLWPKFNLQGHYNWISILDEIIYKYNNTRHRTIKMKPIDVNYKNEKNLLYTVYNNIKIFRYGKFRKGDYVRISKEKSIFYKSYLPNWSTEIFIIAKVNITNPITYDLIDLQNNKISGKFYQEEIQKTTLFDTYLVEKILKRKKDKLYVKWLGFDSTHNSWINKHNLVKV